MDKRKFKDFEFSFWNSIYNLCWKLRLYRLCSRYLYRKVYNCLIGAEANGLTFVGPKI